MKNKYWLNLFLIIFGFNFVISQTEPADILLEGTVSVENNQIKNLADPTDEKDAVNKDYVDEIINYLQSQINELQDIVFDGIDNDGDGFSENQGDCDDNNAAINPNSLENCDGIDNNCNGTVDELDGDSFTGQYVMTFDGGGLAELSNSPVFGTDQLVTLEISGLNSRSFSSPLVYPGFGGFQAVPVELFFNCGGVTLSDNVDVQIGCGNGNVILGPEGGSYIELDDSSFTLIFTEDINSSCGNPAPTYYTFTKIN